jgi:hypothetical protein
MRRPERCSGHERGQNRGLSAPCGRRFHVQHHQPPPISSCFSSVECGDLRCLPAGEPSLRSNTSLTLTSAYLVITKRPPSSNRFGPELDRRLENCTCAFCSPVVPDL